MSSCALFLWEARQGRVRKQPAATGHTVMSYGETAAHCVCPLCAHDYLKSLRIDPLLMSSLTDPHTHILHSLQNECPQALEVQ